MHLSIEGKPYTRAVAVEKVRQLAALLNIPIDHLVVNGHTAGLFYDLWPTSKGLYLLVTEDVFSKVSPEVIQFLNTNNIWFPYKSINQHDLHILTNFIDGVRVLVFDELYKNYNTRNRREEPPEDLLIALKRKKAELDRAKIKPLELDDGLAYLAEVMQLTVNDMLDEFNERPLLFAVRLVFDSKDRAWHAIVSDNDVKLKRLVDKTRADYSNKNHSVLPLELKHSEYDLKFTISRHK